jgi:hypothetical protein
MRQPKGLEKDQADALQAEWGRERDKTFQRFQQGYQQTAPMFFTEDSHVLPLADIYRGKSCFLLCSGPSFNELDPTLLNQPGIVVAAINNSPKTLREKAGMSPHIWVSVDSPDHWIASIWQDPTILKFAPLSHTQKKIFDSDKWRYTGEKVGDMPNMVYYKRNEHFQAKQFLYEDTFNWGNHSDRGGGRSVMLPAMRVLFLLGFRRVYLLGCDFNMTPDKTYHFDQKRHGSSVRGNMSTYAKLQQWFTELRPHFEKENFHVYNCNPNSNLKAFDHVPYDKALAEVRSHMKNRDFAKERTRNLYDTDTREKEEGTGKEVTWFKTQAKGLKRCRYCNKGCAKVAGDEKKPGLIQVTTGCERSRRKLWKANGKGYEGSMDLIRTLWLPEPEAVKDWNKRFSKEADQPEPKVDK